MDAFNEWLARGGNVYAGQIQSNVDRFWSLLAGASTTALSSALLNRSQWLNRDTLASVGADDDDRPTMAHALSTSVRSGVAMATSKLHVASDIGDTDEKPIGWDEGEPSGLLPCKMEPKESQLKFGIERILADSGKKLTADPRGGPTFAALSLSLPADWRQLPFGNDEQFPSQSSFATPMLLDSMDHNSDNQLHLGRSESDVRGTGAKGRWSTAGSGGSLTAQLWASTLGGRAGQLLAAYGKPKRCMMRRAVFSEGQRRGLEHIFQKQKYISKPDRKKLADKLGLRDAQVKIWFQNRRMKWRNSQEKQLLYSNLEKVHSASHSSAGGLSPGVDHSVGT